MIQDWDLRYAANMRNYEGYSIGKLLGLINDPEIISLAGGLPSPDMFLKAELQVATRQRLERDIDRIQYRKQRGREQTVDTGEHCHRNQPAHAYDRQPCDHQHAKQYRVQKVFHAQPPPSTVFGRSLP